ncbi:MAG: M56 family metallopeptidase [Bacteroidia bacterium]
MKSLLPYLIAVNLLLLLQAVYFRVFLARQRRFAWNRAFLVGGLVVALLLPLLRWEIIPQGLPDTGFLHQVPAMVTGADAGAYAATSGPVAISHSGVVDTLSTGLPMSHAVPAASPILTTTTQWSIWMVASMVYLAIAGLLMLVLLYRNILIWLQINRGAKTKMSDHTLVHTANEIGPATYFRYILWKNDPAQDPQDAAVALAHERCHARQLHTIDLLAVEVIRAFCWFNPAIYLMRRDLRRTHEYLADQAALAVAGSEAVRRLLLQRQLRTPHLHIVHPFYSLIKSRLKMLAPSPQKKALLGYFMILPLAAIMVAGTNSCSTVEGKDVAALDSPMTVNAPANESEASGSATPTSAASDNYSPFFSMDKLYLENEMSNYAGNPKSDKTVCLGEMPQTLDMSDPAAPHDNWPEGHPVVLNHNEVIKAIGNPNPDKKNRKIVQVTAKVLVDETGHVIRYQFTDEAAPANYQTAVQAHIEELLFKPGTEKGKPAKWWVIMPFVLGGDGC